MDPEQPTARRPRPGQPVISLLRRGPAREVRIRGLKPFLQKVMAAAGARPDEVTVVLSGDEEVRGLNRTYRGQNRATDVLSFPGGALPDGRFHQGEMIISVEKARRQAAQRRHSLDTELRYLLIHGFLHLTGLDHETDAGQMEEEERRVRQLLLSARGRPR